MLGAATMQFRFNIQGENSRYKVNVNDSNSLKEKQINRIKLTFDKHILELCNCPEEKNFLCYKSL